MFPEDASSPIPNVNVIDINKVKKGGGSDLYLVIASPLPAETEPLERLMQKLETYLAFIGSEQFRSASGLASPENTRIIVKLHPNSDPKARELLERNAGWVRNNGATLVIDSDLSSA
jgi:hypothetical protein